MLDTLLDFVLRQQRIIFPVFGVIFAIMGIAITYGWVSRHVFYPRRNRAGDRDRSLGWKQRTVPVWAAVGFGMIGLWLGWSMCVPPTVALRLPTPVCQRAGNTQLLMFLHGWRGDDTTWMHFPELACTDTRLEKMDVLVINYPTFAARRALDIVALADWVRQQLEGNSRLGLYTSIRIIAHSLGGLVARELIVLKRLRESKSSSIDLLVEVGTLHKGTRLAWFSELSQLLFHEPASELVSLIPNSLYLEGLEQRWRAMQQRTWTICYASSDDQVVSKDSATSGCDDVVFYPAYGHIEMVKPESREDVRYALPIQRVVTWRVTSGAEKR